MTRRLWVRYALLLVLVSGASIAIGAVGVAVFGWADEILVSNRLPLEVEQRLQELDAQMLPLQNDVDAIIAQWFTPESQLGRAALLLAIAATCVGLSVAIAVLTSHWITSPVSAATARLRLLAEGDLTDYAKLETQSEAGGEIAQLLDDVNVLSSKLKERETRIRKDTAAIAHELRTPLTAMMSQLHAIDDGVITAEPPEIKTLLRNGDRLARIIDDLRTLSLADAGELRLNMEVCDLSAVVANAAVDMKHQFDQAGITLNNSTGTVVADADCDRISQLTQCILSNVLRHAKGCSEVTMECEIVEGKAHVRITDDGIGIETDQDIFSPFWRESSETSGLGLAIAAAITKAHNGTILAETNAMGGTTVVILFPAQQQAR